MKIVLFSGKAESGKTTAANMLHDYLVYCGYRVAIIPYADYLKNSARLIFDWNGEKDEAGRELLQKWGTDIVRAKDPNFWVDTVVRLVEVAEEQLDYILIDDVRFPNELQVWREHCKYGDSVTHIRMERPGHQNKLTEEQRQHPSETALDYCYADAVISSTNTASIALNIYDIGCRIKTGRKPMKTIYYDRYMTDNVELTAEDGTVYRGEYVDHRIVRETIPVEKYAYDCRHGDDDWCAPVTIEEGVVVVNFAGTFITDTPIDFMGDDYIDIIDQNYICLKGKTTL